jgi:hypothetical protein
VHVEKMKLEKAEKHLNCPTGDICGCHLDMNEYCRAETTLGNEHLDGSLKIHGKKKISFSDWK